MNKHRIIIALLAFSVLLVVPLCALAATETTLMPTVGVNSEVVHPVGEFLVYVATDGEWQEAGRLSFDRYFRQENLDLGKYISGDGNVRIRLVQKGGEAAHIDAVLLGERSPAEVRGLDDVLAMKKVSEQDFDVVDAFQKKVELVFPSGDTDRVLSLTARVEGSRISETPFHYPLGNLYEKITADSEFYSYRLAEEQVVPASTSKPDMSEIPFFKEYSVTGSGHPSGYTYGWVSNDRENLYVTMDFTPDDTMDGDKDYAKVYVKTEDGIREFKVSVPETRWGRPDFTYTDKVAYQHKVYDFAIPLKELGVNDASKDKELLLAFAAYGTAAPIIEVVKTGDTLSMVGNDVNYTITLSNISWVGPPPLECTAVDSLLGEVFTGILPQGDTVLNLSRTVQEGDPDPLVNTVTLTCTLDGLITTESASHSVNLFQPAIEVAKTGPDTAAKGETISYDFTVNNLSSADSPDLILESMVDTFLGDLTAAAGAAGCSTLAAGASCSFSVAYTIQSTDPSPLMNTVTVVYHTSGFPNYISDSDDHTVEISAEEPQCTLTLGYWKNHEDTWIVISPSTPFFLSGQSYYEVLWTAPRSNAYYILAHQYIAAALNALNGADLTPTIADVLADATDLFSYYTPDEVAAAKGKYGQELRHQFTSLASLLDDYNSGLTGPGSCSCPCWTGEDLSSLTASSCQESPDGEYISVETYENFSLSTYGSEFPGCDVVDHNQNIGFALAITYDQFLDCRDGLEKLRNEAGLTCAAP